MKHQLQLKTRYREQELKEIAAMLFFCYPLIYKIVCYITYFAGLTVIARETALVITYLPLFFVIVKAPRNFVPDFVALWLAVVLFLGVTLWYHPEYEPWYTKDTYGVWPYVLRPENGLYAYLFIRLLNDPESIIRMLKRSSWIMYVYYLYVLIDAKRTGYWVAINYMGFEVRETYDLDYGYNLLFYVLVFMFLAIHEKKPIYFLMSLIGIGMILMGGSRGPLVCLVLFVALMILQKLWRMRHRGIILTAAAGLVAAVVLCRKQIFMLVGKVIEMLPVESRTLEMIASGEIFDSTGRGKIWGAAVQMIKDNPFGYGAMGTRHVISSYHYVGHCHQIFLELLVDFGVIFGTLIILGMIIASFKIILCEKDPLWRGIFIIFLARSGHLLLSGTYWHVFSFWGCIAVGVCIHQKNKKARKMEKGRIQ